MVIVWVLLLAKVGRLPVPMLLRLPLLSLPLLLELRVLLMFPLVDVFIYQRVCGKSRNRLPEPDHSLGGSRQFGNLKLVQR
jgi:hypothetical protein